MTFSHIFSVYLTVMSACRSCRGTKCSNLYPLGGMFFRLCLHSTGGINVVSPLSYVPIIYPMYLHVLRVIVDPPRMSEEMTCLVCSIFRCHHAALIRDFDSSVNGNKSLIHCVKENHSSKIEKENPYSSPPSHPLPLLTMLSHSVLCSYNTLKISRQNILLDRPRNRLQRFMRLTLIIIILHILQRRKGRLDSDIEPFVPRIREQRADSEVGDVGFSVLYNTIIY